MNDHGTNGSHAGPDAPMRWALISGDGLPVSGLLTIFRNVVDRAREAGLLELPVTADLGYSWRPDKGAFFPSGLPGTPYPDWLAVHDEVPVQREQQALMRELNEIRAAVAGAERLDAAQRAELHERVEALAGPYESYFDRWFAEQDVTWVIAVNMTLSDAVPVTTALHRAARRRWRDGRPGGVLYWDHDLFASCAIHENGERVYPATPNEFTPLPGTQAADRWAVVSPELVEETRSYPTPLRPDLVTNVLPAPPGDRLDERHHRFRRDHAIAAERPVVLVPVRVFEVKGVELAVAVFAGIRAECARTGRPEPVLLVFGSLDEDPDYAVRVRREVRDRQVGDAVIFLDGVPLSSHHDGERWRLDEVDLLRLAHASHGAVLFTPNRDDVETVGLGPALAALADLPCAVTDYRAFDAAFGADYTRVRVDPADCTAAGVELAGWMAARAAGEAWLLETLRANRARVESRFPERPWTTLLRQMAAGVPAGRE